MQLLKGLFAGLAFLWDMTFGEDPYDTGYDPYD